MSKALENLHRIERKKKNLLEMVFLIWKITAHLSSVRGTHLTGTGIKALFKACHTWILSVPYSEI